MRTVIASLTLILSFTACGDGSPVKQPANHAAAGSVRAPIDSVPGKCTQGRRFGFMFWGHAKGAEAERAMKDRFHADVPDAVVWGTDETTMTVVVPDEAAGEGLIKEARTLHLKVARVDWVGISSDCKLTWMNHGERLPPSSADVPDAGGPPSDAGPSGDSDAGPGPVCEAALDKSMGPYSKAVDHQTSITSTRMLLSIFSKACAKSFPEFAKAAEHASHVGRLERSKTLAVAASATCPAAEKAATASEVVDQCPPVENDTKLPVWRLLDAGTYAFCQALRHAGVHGTFVDELILQASLHPELDK